MRDDTAGGPQPAWMATWSTAYPRPVGNWALARRGAFGRLDPETGRASMVDPADDRRLPSLVRVLPRGELIGYRYQRRAVLATSGGFVKVVRPSRLTRLVTVHEALADAVRGVLDIPAVTVIDDEGAAGLSVVGGWSLHRQLRHGAGDDVLAAAARALVALHETQAPAVLVPGTVDDTGRWVDIVGRHDPVVATALAHQSMVIDAAVAATAPPSAEALVVVHGDCHDKNLFVDGCRRGLIDLDGVRLGPREDDVANLAVHVALRSLQAGEPAHRALVRRDVVVDSYRRHAPLDDERMTATEAAVWFRLACLYRYRAAGRPLLPTMLALARAALGGR